MTSHNIALSCALCADIAYTLHVGGGQHLPKIAPAKSTGLQADSTFQSWLSDLRTRDTRSAVPTKNNSPPPPLSTCQRQDLQLPHYHNQNRPNVSDSCSMVLESHDPVLIDTVNVLRFLFPHVNEVNLDYIQEFLGNDGFLHPLLP